MTLTIVKVFGVLKGLVMLTGGGLFFWGLIGPGTGTEMFAGVAIFMVLSMFGGETEEEEDDESEEEESTGFSIVSS